MLMPKLTQKQWYMAGVVALVIAAYLIGRRNRASREQVAISEIRQDASQQGYDTEAIIADAKKLYTEFGLDGLFGLGWPWENETGIMAIMRKYDAASYPLLSRTYNRIYDRSLRVDLRKYLSPSDLAEIANIALI